MTRFGTKKALAIAAAIVVATLAIAVTVGVALVRQTERPVDVAAVVALQGGSTCPTATATVSTTKQLKKALAAARPGTSIRLKAATYSGRFTARVAGTADRPISLCGPRDAVLDGGGTSKGYVLHLDGADHWRVTGFSVQNGQKGVMADATSDTVISGLSLSDIGDEAIHLRNFSSNNLVSGNLIRDTGQRKAKFGEGVYVGTAESNWCSVSNCRPDESNGNTIEGNDIAATTSESVDLKEGTSGGVLRANSFDGSSIVGADSWVDVKGNGWLIEGNSGVNSPGDGFQTHEILDGWGTDNVFRSNTAAVNGPGFGFSLTPTLDNVVECSNTASGAGEGTSNVSCD